MGSCPAVFFEPTIKGDSVSRTASLVPRRYPSCRTLPLHECTTGGAALTSSFPGRCRWHRERLLKGEVFSLSLWVYTVRLGAHIDAVFG